MTNTSSPSLPSSRAVALYAAFVMLVFAAALVPVVVWVEPGVVALVVALVLVAGACVVHAARSFLRE